MNWIFIVLEVAAFALLAVAKSFADNGGGEDDDE
jgi:hypothetical protein